MNPEASPASVPVSEGAESAPIVGLDDESRPEPTEAQLLDWYTCKRKQRYAARKTATYAARRFGGLVMPYACQRCNGWHVGHPSPLRDVAVNARRRRRRLVGRAVMAWRKAGRPTLSEGISA